MANIILQSSKDSSANNQNYKCDANPYFAFIYKEQERIINVSEIMQYIDYIPADKQAYAKDLFHNYIKTKECP